MAFLTLRVMLENTRAAGADKSLQAAPGLSLLVQDEQPLFCLIPGRMTALVECREEWALTCLNYRRYSHGHYDHRGGVPWLADNTRVICHPHIACERYSAITVAGYSQKSKHHDTDLPPAYDPIPASHLRLASAFCGPATNVPTPQAYGVIQEQTDPNRLHHRSKRIDLSVWSVD